MAANGKAEPSDLDDLTTRQAAFVAAYTGGETFGNATASYWAAGYDASTESVASSCASRMLRNEKVALAIKAALEASPHLASDPEIGKFWTDRMRDDDEGTKERLRASELLAKVRGMFIERLEVTGEGGGPVIVEVPARVPTEDFAAAARAEKARAEKLRKEREKAAASP